MRNDFSIEQTLQPREEGLNTLESNDVGAHQPIPPHMLTFEEGNVDFLLNNEVEEQEFIQREKELREINELRIRTLEKLVNEKTSIIHS